MKKIYTLFAITMLLASCGGKKEQSVQDVMSSNDLVKLHEKKALLEDKVQALSEDIKLLNDKISELDTNKKVPLITVLTAEKGAFDHYLELQGSVQTKQNVLIYPEMPGQLVRIYVKEGQYVKKGQILAKIDDGGLSNQLAQVQAQAALAETTYKRQKRLWEQKIGSEIQFLQTKTNYEAQTNAVSQLKRQLAKSTITAPFSGVIDDVMKEQGTVVAPGMGSEVFRIVNLKDMYIETDVPESYITAVKRGKKVEVEFPILGEKMTSQIRQAGNFINPANRTFKVEVGVPNKEGKIKPNLTAKLKINDYSNENAILIPQSIISENASGEQYIFIVENVNGDVGEAKQTIIKTGKTQGDVIEVLSGVENGTKIIVEGARSVKNGQEVKILDDKQ